MCLSLETLTSIIRELCYNFSLPNDLTQMFKFVAQIPDYDSQRSARLDFFLLTLVFVLQWLSFHWEILIMLFSQFALTFRQTHNWMLHFTA